MLSNPAIKRRVGPAGPAALLLVLVTLTLVAADRVTELESSFYDFLQRQQPVTASDRILLVSTDPNPDINPASNPDLWEPARFGELLNALNTAGAERIVPVEAPPTNSQFPSLQRLDALIEMQERARQLDGGASDEDLVKQLASFRNQYEQQAAIESMVNEAGNIVLALPNEGAQTNIGRCANLAIPLSGETASALLNAVRSISNSPSLPAGLCSAALNSGINQYWPDADQVVRRTNLLVNSGGALYPALALAGMLSTSATDGLELGDPGTITVDGNQIRTSSEYTSLNRFYHAKAGEQPFETISADALLSGAVPAEMIRGRIAVVGRLNDNAYKTPLNQSIPAATLLATSLSNLIQVDFILRPGWLRWAELILVLFLGTTLLIAVPGMSRLTAALAALGVPALLLASEAYLFLAQGFWVHMVTPTLFCVIGIGCLQAIRGMFSLMGNEPVTAPAATTNPNNTQGQEELDLAFSVLRQQPATDNTKAKLYQIAVTHGKKREFAKAERVLRHLASLDPEYRNVSDKLRKLSGARLNKSQKSQKPQTDSVPMPKLPKHSATGARRTLGRYQVENVLGRGAMATVYLGRDPNINRQVAIKTIALSEEFSDADLENARNQFMREAESAGRLNHPNIISIYDAGEDDGVAYLAMEYFEGDALSVHAIPGNLLPPKWVLELMARAADALHYAHGQKVVHRDIKPANIMYNAASDSLKITDFGIARLTDTSRTKTGIILGTPSYMSPEQLSAAPVTGCSDLYSLGITMYQLITGRAPFRAESIPKLMDKIVNEKHQLLSAERDDIPSIVDEVLDQALAKNPEDRFPNGRAMALALRDCCSSF